MADPERTMLDRADVGRVVAPAAHSHGGSEIGSHAGSHARGGSDPITPASIRAQPGDAGRYDAHADDLHESGTYWLVSGSFTVANGWPLPRMGNSASVTVTRAIQYTVQTVTTNYGEVWTRIYWGGWQAWQRLGPDTPTDIGAYPATGSTYTGHVRDLIEPGTYRISSSSMNAGNGYPWTPDAVGYVIVHRYNPSYVTQEVISETGTTWRRNTVAGSSTAWRDWTPIAVDTGWRVLPLDNGWTGTLRFRWRNGIVTVSVTSLDGTNATSANIVNNLGSNPAFHAGAGTPAHGLGHLTSNAAAPQESNIGSIGMLGGVTNSIMRASSIVGWRGGAASMTYLASSMNLPANLPGAPA